MQATNSLNINSPEILINSWLDMNVRIWSERGSASQDEMGVFLLANILELGQTHGKVIPMFKWLQSKHARECFYLADADSAGDWVLDAVWSLAHDLKVYDSEYLEEELADELVQYIEQNAEAFKYSLVLGEPVYVRDELINSTYEELYGSRKTW